jgi:hypothetical protein
VDLLENRVLATGVTEFPLALAPNTSVLLALKDYGKIP